MSIYELRFDDRERRAKDGIWREIAPFLQSRYFPDAERILELGTDFGYFIRNVRAPERWASDVRDTSAEMPDDVKFVQADGLALGDLLPHEHFDVVFMSNYLEHLSSSENVIEQLRVAHRLTRTGGRLVILQPNIALIGAAYWDFIDHKVALTDKSLVEAAELAGFRTERLVRRFLPYSVKGRLPASPRLVRAFLHVPLAWRMLGRQTLYVGQR